MPFCWKVYSSKGGKTELQANDLKRCVVIDFAAQWTAHDLRIHDVLAYRDLSKEGDSAAAGRILFEALRWAEDVPNAQFVLLPNMFAKVRAPFLGKFESNFMNGLPNDSGGDFCFVYRKQNIRQQLGTGFFALLLENRVF